MKKKVLVTGGAGFIGSNLVRHLVESEDYEVTVLDNFFTGKEENISHFPIEIIEGDVENYDLLHKTIQR